MPITGNNIDNNALAALSRQAAPRIVNAIKTASARTGVDFAYLMEKAAAESSFDAKAESRTSSAAGLYQFIERTWLQMVKTHGDKYGLGQYADKIDSKGRVADPAVREEILELRKNPEKAALLAAEYAADNKQYLLRHTNLDENNIGPTEMYLAHFMGAGGAAGFINALEKEPLAAAADIFPKAARANRNVFYDSKTGEARTLAGVYDFFDRKFSDGRPQTALAENAAPRPSVPPVKPAPSRAALQELLARSMDSDRAIIDFLSGDAPEPREMGIGWNAPRHGVSGGNLVMHPAELMIMAQMDLPERQPRYND